MQIIFSTPDERETIRRLCDDLAAKHSPLYKQAHLLLKGAMDAPIDVSVLLDCEDFFRAIKEATQGAGQIDGNSILRPGERMKTTARKLLAKVSALLNLKGATESPIRESDALAACRFAEEVFRVTPGMNVSRETEAPARLRAVIQANPNAGIK